MDGGETVIGLARARAFFSAIAIALGACNVALVPRAALAQAADVPYVPTPMNVVEAMLDIAQVGPQDFVVDLGSGDGRIVITAAKKYGASGFGVDLDGASFRKRNAKRSDRVSPAESSFTRAICSSPTSARRRCSRPISSLR